MQGVNFLKWDSDIFFGIRCLFAILNLNKRCHLSYTFEFVEKEIITPENTPFHTDICNGNLSGR